jgi:RHS repeat-associated protein
LWGNVLAETNGTATGTTREYIWLPEVEIEPADGARSQVDRPIAVVNAVNTATPATWYVSVDHLNRPIKMTDAAKASVWDAVWQPWGGVHSITGTASLDARLPGQWFQAETGLHYNWHRQYDPTVGRYTQPDPLGFVDGPSVYGYVGGLPQQLLDPDGLFFAWCLRNPRACGAAVAAAPGAARQLWQDTNIDGPSPGLWYGNGRVCQVRYRKIPIFRLDDAAIEGGQNQVPRLHYHTPPDMKIHRCLDPRGC